MENSGEWECGEERDGERDRAEEGGAGGYMRVSRTEGGSRDGVDGGNVGVQIMSGEVEGLRDCRDSGEMEEGEGAVGMNVGDEGILEEERKGGEEVEAGNAMRMPTAQRVGAEEVGERS